MGSCVDDDILRRLVRRKEPDAVHLHSVAVDDVLAAVVAFIDRVPCPVDEPDGSDVFVNDGSVVLMGAKNILSPLPKTKPPGYTSYLW